MHVADLADFFRRVLEDTPARGYYFAEVLLLDQGTTAFKARAELGWSPTQPGLVDEFRHGSYHKVLVG